VSRPPGRAGFAQWLAGLTADGLAANGMAPPWRPEAGTADDNIEESGLDARTHALVRLAAAVAAGEPGQGYDHDVATALEQGVTVDEMTGVLVALLPRVGAGRVCAAAPVLLSAIDRVTAGPPAARRCP
jgi:alkylhydroperoxidase/carboxymuconolactone decarboxylase family protein YurZ